MTRHRRRRPHQPRQEPAPPSPPLAPLPPALTPEHPRQAAYRAERWKWTEPQIRDNEAGFKRHRNPKDEAP